MRVEHASASDPDIVRHLEHLKVERRLAARTLVLYAEAFEKLQRFAGIARVPLRTADVAHVRRWAAQLHALGYATIEAANAADALKILDTSEPFDLLFTDIIMPGNMNGRQLATAVQRLRPGMPVLFTSGYTENAIVHHGKLDSGILLLAKPYRKSELARMIRRAIEG